MAKNSSIYVKRGNLNFKERKIISEINEAIEKNPHLESQISPAENFDSLEELHAKIIADDVDFEIVNDATKIKVAESPKPAFIDPLNRDEPNVRDYVMDDMFDPFADFTKQDVKSNFKEPTNFGQAFDLPDEDEMTSGKSQSKEPNNQNARAKERPQSNQRPSIMNGFEDNGKDKKRSKRFAKSIVNTVCNLLEVGFVWYATKDISEQKLAEYELTQEIDLSALVSLPTGEEITIKEFFQSQLAGITEASKISNEEREELIEDLTEVFIEKNIKPSATYSAGMSALSIVAQKGVQLYVISSQNSQILNQLKERNSIAREESQFDDEAEQRRQELKTMAEKQKQKQSPDISPEKSEPIDEEIYDQEIALLTETKTKE